MYTYLSYRDPNLLKTVEEYDGTPNFLRSLELDNDALTKVRQQELASVRMKKPRGWIDLATPLHEPWPSFAVFPGGVLVSLQP